MERATIGIVFERIIVSSLRVYVRMDLMIEREHPGVNVMQPLQDACRLAEGMCPGVRDYIYVMRSVNCGHSVSSLANILSKVCASSDPGLLSRPIIAPS